MTHMRSSWRALIGVLMILGGIACLPLAVPAGAQTREVTVSVRALAPFVMTQDNKRTGFTVELWEEIAKREGWSTRYIDAENVAAQLKDVSDGRADVAAGAISITGERVMSYDFSQPTLAAGLQILVPRHSAAPAEPGIANFLPLLFSKNMLLWLLGGLALALIPAHITWLAERRHPDSMVSKSYFPGIFQAFIFSGETLTATQEAVPRHWFSRALTILWGFVAIVFVSFFTATLTTTLTALVATSALTLSGCGNADPLSPTSPSARSRIESAVWFSALKLINASLSSPFGVRSSRQPMSIGAPVTSIRFLMTDSSGTWL